MIRLGLQVPHVTCQACEYALADTCRPKRMCFSPLPLPMCVFHSQLLPSAWVWGVWSVFFFLQVLWLNRLFMSAFLNFLFWCLFWVLAARNGISAFLHVPWVCYLCGSGVDVLLMFSLTFRVLSCLRRWMGGHVSLPCLVFFVVGGGGGVKRWEDHNVNWLTFMSFQSHSSVKEWKEKFVTSAY